MRLRWITALSFVTALCAVLCATTTARAQDCTAPRILLIMDTSTSMNGEIDDGNGGMITKWAAAQDAIDQVLTTYPDHAQYGLMLFPGVAAGCSTGEVVVDVAAGTAGSINQTISSYVVQNGAFTPAGQSLMTASNYGGITAQGVPNYVIFVTDGHQWCDVGDPATCATASDCALMGVSPCPDCSPDLPDGCFCVQDWPVIGTQALADQGVTTYVVGFGEQVNIRYLNEAAHVGGAPLPNCDPTEDEFASCFFQATMASELTAHLAQIVLETLSESCLGDCGIGGTRLCTVNGWTDCDAPTTQSCMSSCDTPGTQECINDQLTVCSSEVDCGTGGGGTGASGAGTPTGGSGGVGNAGGAPPGVAADPEDEGSCGCRTVGRLDEGRLAPLALLLALGGLARTRRRRG